METKEDRFLTRKEVAEILGITRQHADTMLKSGTFPRVVDISLPGATRRTLRVRASDLQDWIDGRTVSPCDCDDPDCGETRTDAERAAVAALAIP